MLDICVEHKIDVSNVTTNGFGLTPAVIDRLLTLETSEIIISFNEFGEEEYAKTNGTTARAYHKVLANITNLVEEKKRRGLETPRIAQQFFGRHALVFL